MTVCDLLYVISVIMIYSLMWLYVVFKTMCDCFRYEILIELLIGIIINKELLLIDNCY